MSFFMVHRYYRKGLGTTDIENLLKQGTSNGGYSRFRNLTEPSRSPTKKQRKPEGLEKIALHAFERLTPEIARIFSRASNSIQAIRSYISKFTEGLPLTQNQINDVIRIFLGHVKGKISQIKNLREQLEDYSSINSEERKNREKGACDHILSYLNEKEEIITKNPFNTFSELATNFYEKKGFKIKNYEIRNITRLMVRKTLYSEGKVTSLTKQIQELKSFNDPKRKERMNFARREINEYIGKGGEIPVGQNPINILRKLVKIVYKKSDYPLYENEIRIVAGRIFEIMNNQRTNKIRPLEGILAPSYA